MVRYAKGRRVGSGTILGGLPVLASVDGGYDGFSGEHWCEVVGIFWMKRNGQPGKAIPDHLWDKAHDYDPGFANLMEQVFDCFAMEDCDEE